MLFSAVFIKVNFKVVSGAGVKDSSLEIIRIERLQQGKRQEQERGKYVIRPLLSLERLSFKEKEDKMSYQYGKENLE